MPRRAPAAGVKELDQDILPADIPKVTERSVTLSFLEETVVYSEVLFRK